MTDREREARIRERKIRNRITATRKGGLTLYTGCERATSDIDYLLSRVERYREALEDAIAHHEEQASAWNGAYELTGEQALKVDYHRERAAELHRALNDGEENG